MTSAILVAVLAALSAIDPASALSVSTRHDGYNPGSAHPSNGICTDFTITKTVTALNYPFALPKWKNNYDVAGFLESLARKPAKDPKDAFVPLGKPSNLTQTHTIFATFCSPKHTKKGKESTVLVATHGLGYDGRYWASTYKPEEYSFVGHALDAGYSVFYYDRVGTGKSKGPSGFVTQESDQQALLSKIVKDIRGGKWTNKIQAKKIVLVGHSFGSFTSSGLIAAEPDLVEGESSRKPYS
jgi:pimeloyl-ACP methyl ester carboxylesterase